MEIVLEFIKGMAVPFRAAAVFVTRPRYWSYSLLPLLLCLICYIAVGLLGWIYLKPYLDSLIPAAATDSGVWSSISHVARWLLYVSALIAGTTVFLLTFTNVCILVAAPFVDILSARYEKDFYNVDFICSGFRHYMHYCWTSTINSARLALVIILLSIVFMVINIFAPVMVLLSTVWIGYYFGLTFMIYSSEHRRIKFSDFRLQAGCHRAYIAGMGTVIYILMFIPFIAVLALPVAVIAGTIAFNERLESTPTE